MLAYTNNHTHAHKNDESTLFTVKALSIIFNVGTPKHRNTEISSALGRDTNHMSMILTARDEGLDGICVECLKLCIIGSISV